MQKMIMKMTKYEKTARFFANMEKLGFSYDEAVSLRRIEMTLSNWSAQECGDSNDFCSWSIERDEAKGKPFRVVYPHAAGSKVRRSPVPDRERGALIRLKKIMSSHSDLWFFHQTDPRGCSLHIGRLVDVKGQEIDRVYNRGTAVCID